MREISVLAADDSHGHQPRRDEDEKRREGWPGRARVQDRPRREPCDSQHQVGHGQDHDGVVGDHRVAEPEDAERHAERHRKPSRLQRLQVEDQHPRHHHRRGELGHRAAHEPVGHRVVRRDERAACNAGGEAAGAEHPHQPMEPAGAGQEQDAERDDHRALERSRDERDRPRHEVEELVIHERKRRAEPGDIGARPDGHDVEPREVARVDERSQGEQVPFVIVGPARVSPQRAQRRGREAGQDQQDAGTRP